MNKLSLLDRFAAEAASIGDESSKEPA